MTIDELQSSLLVHEQHMKGHKEEGQVLHISNAGTGFGQVYWFLKGKTTHIAL